jgi:hypothetical protein
LRCRASHTRDPRISITSPWSPPLYSTGPADGHSYERVAPFDVLRGSFLRGSAARILLSKWLPSKRAPSKKETSLSALEAGRVLGMIGASLRSFWLTRKSCWSVAWPWRISLLDCRLVAGAASWFCLLPANGALAEQFSTVTRCASTGTGRITSFGARGVFAIARFAMLCCSMGWSRLSSKRSWTSAAETGCLRDYFPALGRPRGLGRPILPRDDPKPPSQGPRRRRGGLGGGGGGRGRRCVRAGQNLHQNQTGPAKPASTPTPPPPM